MNLYKCESSYPKVNAQRNLMGRTHYVDDGTLRFHKSRVISARHTDGGLLFAIVTSDACDYENKKRGFRYVIFDVTGYVVERTQLENAYRTSKRCTDAMWKAIDALNAYDITVAAIVRQETNYQREVRDMRADLAKVRAEGKTK